MSTVSRAIERHVPSRLRPAALLLVRTAQGAMDDRLPGLAAEIAFWIVLSLPALVLTIVSAASAVSGLIGTDWQEQLIEQIADVAQVALTSATIDNFLRPLLEQLVTGGTVGIASVGFIATLWGASRAVRVVLVGLSLVDDRAEQRPGWKDRALGLAITFGALILGTILAPLLLAGPGFGDTLVSWLSNGVTGIDLGVIATLWRTLYWPVMVIVATLAVATLYHFGVPGGTSWRQDFPGAVLATTVWLAGSTGLRVYGSWAAGGTSAYGPLAGPIIALLWVWVSGFAVLLGAEFNAQRAALRRERDPASDVDATGDVTGT